MPRPDSDTDEQVLTKTAKKLKPPPLYRVLLHNDDFTTMEFVVDVLRTVFSRSDAEAVAIMLRVHQEGVGIAGAYTYEIAEAKAAKATALAQAQEYPLLCSVEADEG